MFRSRAYYDAWTTGSRARRVFLTICVASLLGTITFFVGVGIAESRFRPVTANVLESVAKSFLSFGVLLGLASAFFLLVRWSIAELILGYFRPSASLTWLALIVALAGVEFAVLIPTFGDLHFSSANYSLPVQIALATYSITAAVTWWCQLPTRYSNESNPNA